MPLTFNQVIDFGYATFNAGKLTIMPAGLQTSAADLSTMGITDVDFSKLLKLQFSFTLANNSISKLDLSTIKLFNADLDVTNNNLTTVTFGSANFAKTAKLLFAGNPALQVIDFGTTRNVPFLEISADMQSLTFAGIGKTRIEVMHITGKSGGAYYSKLLLNFDTNEFQITKGRRFIL